MSNKTKTQRGRPQLYTIKFPGNKGTINTVQKANKVTCRATVVARFKNWVKEGYLVETDQLVKEGKRGRYSTVYWKAGAWKAYLAMQKRNKDSAKAKKLATVPTVDLTPAPTADVVTA